MSATSDAHRGNERLPFAAEVLVAREDRGWRAEVLDFSESGCALLRPGHFDLHLGAVVTLYLLARNGPGVAVSARLARVGERDLGFEYHENQAIPPNFRAPG